MRLRAFPTFLALGGVVLAACATYDSSLLVDGSGGSAGIGGGGGSSAGTGGTAGGGSGGDAGTSGTAGASGAGAAGKGGSAGTGGTGGGGASGKGGASGAGTGGTAGASGAGTGGTAGSGGASGTAGTSGSAGSAGNAGTAGTAGSAGASGTAGSAGTGGAAGTAGTAGSGGAKSCTGVAECDDTNPCTTDTCDAMLCKHVNLADDTATPGAVNDPKDCKKNVCKAGKDTAVADTTEIPDDANECTTDTCGADGKPVNAKLTGPTCGGGTKHCSVGVCVSNTCGDGVIGDAEECDKTDFGPKSCLDYGFGSPSGLKCTVGCTIDSAGCSAVCGNSKLEGIEECDDDTSKGAPGDGCSKYCMKEPAVGDLVITEILFNPEKSQVGSVETGEWFEIYNASTTAYDLRGLQVGGNGSENFLIDDVKPLVLQPGAYAVLAKNGDPTQNGGVTSVLFVYGTAMALSNSSDSIEIRVPSTPLLVIDRIDYTDGASVGYKGASKELSRTHLNAVDNNGTTSTNWCPATTPFGLGDLGTPGAENGCP